MFGILANLTTLDLPSTSSWSKLLRDHNLLSLLSKTLVPGMAQADLQVRPPGRPSQPCLQAPQPLSPHACRYARLDAAARVTSRPLNVADSSPHMPLVSPTPGPIPPRT